MSVSPHPYRHVSLISGYVFRYLILEPGASDEPLRCTIETAPIEETQFDAISYVWGNTTKDHEIICQNHVMKITANLSNALRHLRRPDKPLTIWADGICINQENDAEKSHQVSLMGKIYRAARHVLIYIGPDDNNECPALLSLINEVNEMIQETISNIDMTWDSFPYPEDDDPLLAHPGWDSLHTLLGKSWFDRGWVVQEAAIAKCAIVNWGNSRLDWNRLMRTYAWLNTRAESLCHDKDFAAVRINAHFNTWVDNNLDTTRVFYDELTWSKPSILMTLTCAKELDLHDPRDRIYAFSDLPQYPIAIYPDYTRTFLEIYRQFAQQCIESTKNTEVLDYVSHNDSSITEIASWVPRWDISKWSLCGSISTPSVLQSRSGFSIEPSIVDNDRLKVQGVILDTVKYASDIFDWDAFSPETIRNLWSDVKELATVHPYITESHPGSLLLDAFLNALSAGIYNGTASQWKEARKSFAHDAGLGSVAEYYFSPVELDSLETDMPTSATTMLGTDTGIENSGGEDTTTGAIDEDSEIQRANIYFSVIRNRTASNKFVLTERGYIGLAPAITRAGDLCGIIFGCKLPCILRKADQDRTFYFIGSTSLRGKEPFIEEDGGVSFDSILGDENSKDWSELEVEEEDIYLC